MSAVKTPKQNKNASVAKQKNVLPGPNGRKNLSPAMLDALIKLSPSHPAADEAAPAKPPFEIQDVDGAAAPIPAGPHHLGFDALAKRETGKTSSRDHLSRR